MNLKKIIREEIKNDLQWIKDTESDELILSPNISFRDDDEIRKIIKDVFDYNDEEINEDLLFNLATEQGYRWSEKHQGWWHLSERVDLESIKESNDFDWVDEIPQYDFYDGEYYIDISELDDDEACEVQQTLINMGIDWREGNGEINKLHCSTFTNKGYIIRKAVLYRTTKSYDDYRYELFRNTPWDAVYIDGRTDLLG